MSFARADAQPHPLQLRVFTPQAADGFTDADSPNRARVVKLLQKDLATKDVHVVRDEQSHELAIAVIGAHEGPAQQEGAVAVPSGPLVVAVPLHERLYSVAAVVYVGETKRQFERTEIGSLEHAEKLLAKDLRQWLHDNAAAVRNRQ